MKINNIQLNNIRSYMDEKIEFPAGSTLLSGDIGCGKSTILQSIEFALFGIGKHISGNDLLRHGSSTGSVKLGLEIDGRNIEITRTLRRGKSISQEACTIMMDGRKQEFMPLEMKSRMLEFLGYSQDMLKKNKPIFRYTVYTPQEEMKKILMDEDERLEILRSVFGVDKYGAIRENAKTFMTELRRMKTGIEGEIRGIETGMSMKKDIEETKFSIISMLSSEKMKLSLAMTEHDRKRGIMDDMKSEFSRLNSARHDLAKKEASLEEKHKRSIRIDADLAENIERISNYRSFLDGSEKINSSDLKREVSRLEADRDKLISERAVLNDESRKLQKIHSEGKCALCGQEVHNPQEFAMHIEEMKSRMGEIAGQVTKIDSATAEIRNTIAAGEKAQHYSKQIVEIESKNSRLDAENMELKGQMASLAEEIESIRPRLHGFDEMQERITQAENDFYQQQKVKSGLESNVARQEQQLEDCNRRLNEIEEKSRHALGLKEKSKKISSLLSWFDPFITVMEIMEKRVMMNIQQEFNQYFQKWFSVLMNDQLSVKIDEKFSPVIEQNTYITEYENLSGGEKTSVALAYRLALNKVINDMTDSIKTKDLIILDEPTDGFSSDQLDRIRDVINELNLRQIIIVSHEAKIDTYVENVIRIFKENHISKIAA